jgi:hypothetical protein
MTAGQARRPDRIRPGEYCSRPAGLSHQGHFGRGASRCFLLPTQVGPSVKSAMGIVFTLTVDGICGCRGRYLGVPLELEGGSDGCSSIDNWR